jgi:urease accessory protein
MVKHTIATKSISRFLQLFDGSFPSGAFVHSFGLEPHIIGGKVSNKEELKLYLENLIKYQYEGNDFVFISKVYKAFENSSLSLLIKEDNSFSAMSSYEFAKASQDIGENYLKQISHLFKKPISKKYIEAIKTKKTFGNELLILAMYAYELGIKKDFFTLLWCKKNLINIATTTLKISRIKPSEIQQLLFEFDDILEECIQNQSKNYNSFNPLFEEIIYQHKVLEPKLFMT